MKIEKFKVLLYLKKSGLDRSSKAPIMGRISIDGKQVVITTGICCQPADCNAKKGVIKTKKENNRLVEFRNRVEHTYEHILKKTGVVSSELLKNTIIGVNSTPTMLLNAGEVERERLRIRSIEINSRTSYRQSGISQRNLQEFLRSRGMEDITFSGITEEFGGSFKIFMKTTGEHKADYINKCITQFNRLVYIAIDQEVLRSNPLEDVRYEKKEPAKHRYIGKHDLKRMMETPMIDPRLELVRRVFIFSTLTGLAYVDMHRLIRKLVTDTIGKPILICRNWGIFIFIPTML